MNKETTASLDQEALVDRMISQLEDRNWHMGGEKNGTKVLWSCATDGPCNGFRTITEYDVNAKTAITYLGRNLCKAMQDMNPMYTDGETIKVLHDRGDEDYYAVVRTCFKMPAPLQNREFLHSLYVTRRDPDTAYIIYHSVYDQDLPPEKEGYLRCHTYLSGQRITTLSESRVRVEHMMVYALGGKISPWIQNKLFHKGHIGAYIKEWQQLDVIFANYGKTRHELQY